MTVRAILEAAFDGGSDGQVTLRLKSDRRMRSVIDIVRQARLPGAVAPPGAGREPASGGDTNSDDARARGRPSDTPGAGRRDAG